jgi:flagellar biosynthesis protein FlhB
MLDDIKPKLKYLNPIFFTKRIFTQPDTHTTFSFEFSD